MKNKFVKILLFTLVLSMCTFSGCGEDEKKDKKDKKKTEESADDDEDDADDEDESDKKSDKKKKKSGKGENQYGSGFPFGEIIAYEDNDKFWQEPTETLDVEKVISIVEMTPEFMYGKFGFYDENSCVCKLEPVSEFTDKCEWVKWTDYMGDVNPENIYKPEKWEISTLPYRFNAGPVSMIYEEVNGIPGYNWCELYFALRDTEKTDTEYIIYQRFEAAYEISGNKIKLQLLGEYDYDWDANSMEYRFSDKVLEYTFERTPFTVSLSDGTNTVNMLSDNFLNSDSKYGPDTSIYAKLNEGETSDIPITDFSIRYEKDYANAGLSLNGRYVDSCSMLMEDGLVILCANPDDVKDDIPTVYQYVLYDCGYDGAILCDESGVYPFLHIGEYQQEKMDTMSLNNIRPEDLEEYNQLDEDELKALIEKRDEILDELGAALTSIGIGINVDTETGEIILDASVFFDSNSYEISKEGKETLEKLAFGLSEVFDLDAYGEFVSEIHITGHTDSDGDYEYNKELSLKRAEAVKKCIIDALADNPDAQARFDEILTVEGCSYDQLVYDENGDEDKAASRRVVFTFYMNLKAFEE